MSTDTQGPAPTAAPDGARMVRPRVRAALPYVVGVGLRTLAALGGLVLLCSPLLDVATGPAPSHGRSSAWALGTLAATLLVLLGLALPSIALVVAPLDWAATGRLLGGRAWPSLGTRLRSPRTWARPLAYVVVQLTVGGLMAVAGFVVTTAAVVALASPALVSGGDVVDLGPAAVRTVPGALAAAAVGVCALAAMALAAPFFAHAHTRLVTMLLTVPEQRLQRDLALATRSRDRVLRAFDLERRRIERDLHDGIQPQLMSVSMTLGLALAAMPDDAPARDDVARAQTQARAAVEDLRRFVRAIHPQVLTDHGLGAAVGELADGLAVPTTVADELGSRPPAVVETNLYYCVAELLTNVVKHAGATSASVTLARPATGCTLVVVEDDGAGGAVTTADGGIAGIADRVAALGGELTMTSPPGGPTRARILAPDDPATAPTTLEPPV